jgi:hypothetical protein
MQENMKEFRAKGLDRARTLLTSRIANIFSRSHGKGALNGTPYPINVEPRNEYGYPVGIATLEAERREKAKTLAAAPLLAEGINDGAGLFKFRI